MLKGLHFALVGLKFASPPLPSKQSHLSPKGENLVPTFASYNC